MIAETVRECFKAYNKRDIETAMATFTDDVVFDWPTTCPAAVWHGRVSGAQGMTDRLMQLDQAFEFLDIRVTELVVEGNKAAVHVEMDLKSKKTGKTVTNHSGQFWYFRDGRCERIVELYDTSLIIGNS